MLFVCAIILLIVGFIIWRLKNYQSASDFAQEKAREMGMIRMDRETIGCKLYRAISWRREAQLQGALANIRLPMILRKPILRCYLLSVGIDMKDVEEQDLTKYETVNKLFLRSIQPSARPIADVCMVAPADCLTYHFGKVSDHDTLIHDAKGFAFTLPAFFGPDVIDRVHKLVDPDEKTGQSALYHFVAYLSPADCHRFYSPADITLFFRRHFTGRMNSVVDTDLFNFNERMLVTGEWKYGFFSMTAIGALEVGAINFYFDNRHTNIKNETVGLHDDRSYSPAVKKRKGEAFGHFEMGSVIVLVFEAPVNFQFTVEKGAKLNFGQGIGKVA